MNEDLRFGQYVRRAMVAIEEHNMAILPYLTSICPECRSQNCTYSLRYRGFVVIACEGYWPINPEVLGLEKGQWQNWKEEDNG